MSGVLSVKQKKLCYILLLIFTVVRVNLIKNTVMPDISRPYGTLYLRGFLFILPIYRPYGTVPLGTTYW